MSAINWCKDKPPFTGLPACNFLEVKEKFCDQSEHKKILDKGLPDDVPPGYKHRQVGLVLFSFSYLLVVCSTTGVVCMHVAQPG